MTNITRFLVAVILSIFTRDAYSALAVEGTIEGNFKASDLIVFGTVRSRESRVGTLIDTWLVRNVPETSEYEVVLTDYVIEATEVFKQDVDSSRVIFTTRGGELEDGTKETYLWEFDLDVGKEVLIFLRWDNDNGWFSPIKGPLGVFLLEIPEHQRGTRVFRGLYEGDLIPRNTKSRGSDSPVRGKSKDRKSVV